jgi:hypothetical protein
MTSVIIAIVTSYWVLGTIGLVLLAALVVGYFPLLKWFPVLGQYVPVAKLVSLLVTGLLCLLIGVRAMNDHYSLQQARDRIELLERRTSAVNSANEHEAGQAIEDDKYVTELRKSARETPKNEAPALDADAAGRIGKIK